MTKVLHISTECYPAAKAGGMGDVVGAIPLYLPDHGIEASVVIPKYKRKWFAEQSFKSVYQGILNLGQFEVKFEVQKLENESLNYPFYCVDIPGLFDREDIYLAEDGHGYKDEAARNISFQVSIMEWLTKGNVQFDILHLHDHMTGLISFFMKFCPEYSSLKSIPTVFTIHNGQYRGIFDWNIYGFLPEFNSWDGGQLDWDGHINSLATAIKCSWIVNTVSPSYMEELIYSFDTLTPLYQKEKHKCQGIINGIDSDLWNPQTDTYLDHHLTNDNWRSFKSQNKSSLLKTFNLKARRPLIGFIGRLTGQKGADILLESIENCLSNNLEFSTIILGSGDKYLEKSLTDLSNRYPRDFEAIIAYDEKLARKIYAGCDFLMMPSRFEPCGLNQMYAMRYGTIPIVSNVGGLKDTVPDIAEGGNGIVARTADRYGFSEAIVRAVALYKNKKDFYKQIEKITKIDYSWDNSARKYAELYQSLIK